jgi:4-alpha-glucanotransferase
MPPTLATEQTGGDDHARHRDRVVRLDVHVTGADDDLRALADAYGVATEYWDWRGQHVTVSAETLTAVLRALDVDTATPDSWHQALARRRSAPWSRMLPPYVVVRAGRPAGVNVHVDSGSSVDVWIHLEDGSYRSRLRQLENWNPPREIDGRWVGEATFEVPADLPCGYHRLGAYSDGVESASQLIVTPDWVGIPDRVGAQPGWGLAVQLYSVRSDRSWGVGDLADLTELATWAAAEHDAMFVLVNPMHAAEPVAPIDPSPYLPTTRRFGNPLYLRVEQIPDYAYLDARTRAEIDALAAPVRAGNRAERIDRDRAWTAKSAALELLYNAGMDPGRRLAYAAFCRQAGPALDDFATWCALTELHGPDWHSWPAEFRHPRSADAAAFGADHPGRADFYRWLQWLVDEQLAAGQAAARRAGLRLGIVHDLAVGVSATGADSWAWQDELAHGITVGAPPDAYAHTGQNWDQPAWRPDRLAELGYAPLRGVIANALRNSGGLRVDHIIGLFRLWWIPVDAPPTAGTYVRYDHDAAVGILALEAQRAGAVVIGEDLGTVEPWVREYLRDLGVLGTSVLWFEFDYEGTGEPLAPERWREYCLASVTTHDLPPTAGYLAGDHIRLRHSLGMLGGALEDELAADARDKAAWLAELHRRGLLEDGADETATVEALHRALAATPARLRCLALTDAVGDRRAQNQPGTTAAQYPNWQIALSGPDGTPVGIADVFASRRAARLAETMRGAS